MKDVIALLIMQSVAMAAVIIAGVMAINNVTGWGYFLFVGCLTIVSKVKTKDKE